MSEEEGHLEEEMVEVIDPSFDLNMKIAFKPTLLPEVIEENMEMGNGQSIKCEYRGIEKRYLYSAYIVKGHKPSGHCRSYHMDGTLKSECYYRLDDLGKSLLHGPSTCVSTDGVMVSKLWYVDGLRVGREFNYFKTGKLRSSVFYEKGLKEGKALYYYENGALKTEMPYKQGSLDGVVLLYHDNGQLSRMVPYQDGKKDSLEKEYGPSGALLATRLFKMGNLLEQYFWSPRGVLLEKHIYLGHEQKVDKWKWDPSGSLRYKAVFDGDEYSQKEWDKDGKIQKMYSGKWNGENIMMRCFNP